MRRPDIGRQQDGRAGKTPERAHPGESRPTRVIREEQDMNMRESLRDVARLVTRVGVGVAILTAVGALATGCGDDEPQLLPSPPANSSPGDQWDVMKWDEGRWARTEAPREEAWLT